MTTISPDTASQEGPDTVGFRSSGTSPGSRPTTLHLVGVGQVGRCLLALLPGTGLRLVAATDSTATAIDPAGLDPAAVAAHKAAGRSLRDWPGAGLIPTATAIAVVGADVVADATASDGPGTLAAVERGRAALRAGAFLALSGKNALAAAGPEWLLGPHRGRVGCNATLGGAGRQLVAELDQLRANTTEVALVGNVTSTVIVQAIEAGASVADGIAHAERLGILEPDPELDLDGSDAAVKLAAVWGAVFGEWYLRPPEGRGIPRPHVRDLDPAVLRERAARGATTRLVGRADRDPRSLRVAFEEVPCGSPLAAPPDRVVYTYRLGAELRVHTGTGIGHQRTAQALLDDVLLREVRR